MTPRSPRNDRLALYLSAVQDSGARVVDLGPVMQGAAVIPQQHVARSPLVGPGVIILSRVPPETIQ